jgi:hypothetical protein
VQVKKGLALVVVAIVGLAFALMFKSLIFGERPSRECEEQDYECNFERYMDDISLMPPTFSRANTLAIETSGAVSANIEKIMTLPDYEASSMMRVLLAYSPSTQRSICQSSRFMEQIEARSEDISSPHQREEFARLISQLKCT